MIMTKTKKDEKMQGAKHHTIWSDELGATRDIRISVAELQLIANQLRDSNNDQLDFLYDMILTAIDNDDLDALNDFTAWQHFLNIR